MAATGTTDPSVTLAWTAATDNVAVAGYRVSRDGTRRWRRSPHRSTSWTDATAAPVPRYTYTVAAVDTSGNVGPAAQRRSP